MTRVGDRAMPYGAVIIASSLSGPCEVLRASGYDPEPLLPDEETTGTLTPDGRLSLTAFVGFFQTAARRLGDPGFGWRAGQSFDIATLGETGRAVASAPTLGEALAAFCRAFALVQTDSLLSLTVEDDQAVLSYRILDPRIWPRDQDAEFTLSILSRLIGAAAGPGWRPTSLAFEHSALRAPRGPEDGPRCAVDYLAPCNALGFPAALLDRPMRPEAARDWTARVRRLEAEASDFARGATLERRVRREVLIRLSDGTAREDDIALALGLSPRSLRRRLAEQGQSFAAVLGTCRQDAARQLLAVDGLRLADVAERLGYADVTCFERAFRRAEGLTPAQFRRARAQRLS